MHVGASDERIVDMIEVAGRLHMTRTYLKIADRA